MKVIVALLNKEEKMIVLENSVVNSVSGAACARVPRIINCRNILYKNFLYIITLIHRIALLQRNWNSTKNL